MNLLRTLAVMALITAGCSASDTNTGWDKDREELQRTSVAIRALRPPYENRVGWGTRTKIFF